MEEKKPNKIYKIAISILIAVALIFFIILYIYVYEVSEVFSADGRMYYAEDEEEMTEFFIQFSGNNVTVFCTPDQFTNLKVDYSFYQKPWKKFFFGTYLTKDSILSMKKPEYEGKPVSFYMTCEKAEYVNIWCTEYGNVEDAIGEKYTLTVYFTDDGAYFDGLYLEKVDEVPDTIETWISIINEMSEE